VGSLVLPPKFEEMFSMIIFLLDTKVVPMSGRDWDIIPKFTDPMQSNFEHFMCSWDRNPKKFSPFEGMSLALQAHLFNRLYQTRATKLKFETHLLGPAPHRDYQRLSHWIHLLEVWGVPPTWGTVPWLYGKWNYEQCFSAGNEGRKRYTKQRVDIIIYIKRRVLTRVFFLGGISPTDSQKKRKPSATSAKDFYWKFSKKISYFLENL